MASVSIYLNFMGNTEEVFNFYKQVFGTQFTAISYMRDVPTDPNQPPLSAEDGGKVMNVQLPIIGGVMLMGTDFLEAMGHELKAGNNVSICLHPDTRADTERLFNALAEGGTVGQTLTDTFWGDYFGTLVDKFGIHWMFNQIKQQ
jgi:PhnB protein